MKSLMNLSKHVAALGLVALAALSGNARAADVIRVGVALSLIHISP